MNDVTEPLVVDKHRGGLGLDYHLVVQGASRSIDFLLNETGTGRVASWIRSYLSQDQLAARWRIYGTDRMVQASLSGPEMVEAWQAALGDLEQIYALARRDNLPVVLVIFPETYQLGNQRLQEPQRILKRHAQSHGVTYVDMTEVAERFVSSGGSVPDIFLDLNHYTVRGHAMIACEISRHLVEMGIAEIHPSEGRLRRSFTTPPG